MMQITRAADYAVRIVVYIAGNGGDRCVPTAELSKKQDIPTAYVSKVLQALSKAGIIATFPGRSGGARLLCDAEELSVLKVVEAVDGRISLNRCVEHKGACPRDSFCRVHPFWAATREKLAEIFGRAMISQFVNDAPDEAWRAKPLGTEG